MKGLLASCIYQFVTQVPDALEQFSLLPESALKYSIDHWSPEELHSLLFNILGRSSTYCCLFLDGLDEFDHQDDDDRLFEFIAEIQRRSKTKVCLSSRPVPYILKRLIKSPTVKLQDLTRNDIYEHVWNTLQEKTDITWQDEMMGQLESLAKEMCNKADGVFLWVHYVLHNVCKGLKAADEIPDLRKRIDELPSEVIEMYKAMWQKNNRDHPIHAQQAAKILSLHRDFPMPFFQLAVLVHPTLANHYSSSQNSIGEDILDEICNKFLLRLPTLSAGLLECHEAAHFTASRATCRIDWIDLNTELWQPKAAWRRMEVRFIHRTVGEFLADNISGSAWLSDVYCEHVTVRDYVQSLLACLAEEVLELNLDNVGIVCSTLRSIPDEDAYIVDHLDASCSQLVRPRYPILRSFTLNWVHCLVEAGNKPWLKLGFLDFPSLLTSCSASGSCMMHVINTRSTNWTPYYKGWLASCLVRGSSESYLDCGNRWTIVVPIFMCLAAHGADISTPQTMDDLWNIRSPVLLLLSQLVVEILNGLTIQDDDLQVPLNLVRELDLESQLMTLCAIVDGKDRLLYFSSGTNFAAIQIGHHPYLISFVAIDLVEMLAAMLGKHASDRPRTRCQGYNGGPRKRGQLHQTQCAAHCRTIARDVARVVGVFTSHPFALLCSSASMRSQTLDAIFLPCTNDNPLPVFDGPEWEVPDIDLTIPFSDFYGPEHKLKLLPVDPYNEVSPHEWKQHCTLRDYYAREAQTQSISEPLRRAEVNRWREARPLWSQSRAVYDSDFDFNSELDSNSEFDSHSEVTSNSDFDDDPPADARPKPRCVFPP